MHMLFHLRFCPMSYARPILFKMWRRVEIQSIIYQIVQIKIRDWMGMFQVLNQPKQHLGLWDWIGWGLMIFRVGEEN
uniref:Uncharacterized protein LOC101308618 n=1 Tax=Rhizophora mucronata TaxID=61149 RepID=A0A2P2PI26_RHIMU